MRQLFKIIFAASLIILVCTASSKKENKVLSQSITITIDDVSDPNAIPDLLSNWGYTGVNTQAAKAAFIKAQIAAYLKDQVRQYRIRQAASTATQTADQNNSAIPIN